jgi:hypothetical protein
MVGSMAAVGIRYTLTIRPDTNTPITATSADHAKHHKALSLIDR